MVRIIPASPDQAETIAQLGRQSFRESHGHSAAAGDIDAYISSKYTTAVMEADLERKENNYYLIYDQDQLAGYSNIVMDTRAPDQDLFPLAKLDRIYILQSFYDRKIGKALFEFNHQLAMQQAQKGIWLYTWKENHRAIRFYERHGFRIIGSTDFPISANHSNPNHIMLLEFLRGDS